MTGAKPMSGMVPVLNKQNTISTQPMRYKVARCVACNTLHAEFDADGCLSVWCDCTLDKSTNGDVIADDKTITPCPHCGTRLGWERAMGSAIDTLLDDYERLRGESEWLRRGLEQARDTLARIADPSDGTRDAGFWSLGGVRAEARVRASISTTYLERKL